MTIQEQVRNLESHAADIADLRGQHQKPMCGFRDFAAQWAGYRIPDASEPYLKY